MISLAASTQVVIFPEKTVIIPDMEAGCSLADSASSKEFNDWIKKHPNHTLVSYINCSAKVKAISDIICTSSNAEKIINSIPDNQPILFAPDQFLGKHLIKKTKRELILWKGFCQVHVMFSLKELIKLKIRYPNAQIIAHPECEEKILNHAHFIGSTTGLIKYTQTKKFNEFIVVTEPGVIHQMKKLNSHKTYIPLSNNEGCACNECPHMRLNTINKMITALKTLQPEIILEHQLIEQAKKPLIKMLELS